MADGIPHTCCCDAASDLDNDARVYHALAVRDVRFFSWQLVAIFKNLIVKFLTNL
jgi:hypothetical protein